MSEPPPTTKAAVRIQARERYLALSDSERRERSEELCAQAIRMKCWQAAKTLLLFAPLPTEPDVWPLLQRALSEAKIVALPGFDANADHYVARRVSNPKVEIVKGKFGIREVVDRSPEISLKQLDLTLVPGVAFDARGGRLGRGKGYYDRLLAEAGGTKCGIAFDEQLVEAVPLDPHDIRLNCILTPTRWIET